MRKLLKLSTNHPDPVNATSDWRRMAYGTILCQKCHKVYRNKFPRPINLVLYSHPGHRIAGGVWWTGIDIFHIGFLNQIREYLADFVIGTCSLPDVK